MRSPVELESEALAEDVKAQQLEAEAFTLSKAGNPTWVINEQQAKSHRDFAFILRQRALLARQQHSSVASLLGFLVGLRLAHRCDDDFMCEGFGNAGSLCKSFLLHQTINVVLCAQRLLPAQL